MTSENKPETFNLFTSHYASLFTRTC